MLTVQMVIRNNESTVRDTLRCFPGQFLIADIGSTDGTAEICRAAGATVVRLSLNDDMAAVRNKLSSLSKTDWNLWVEPWETLLAGEIPQGGDAYRVNILNNDVVTKSTRLWHKKTGKKFKNPVFETMGGEAEDCQVYLASNGGYELDFRRNLLEKWKNKSPLSNEVTYYESCLYLAEKNWGAFLNTADHYLHREKKSTMSAIMTRYYGSMVSAYIEKDGQRAISYLLPCLASRPLMAEFWCLLGDIYYSGGVYEKACIFYENALILGKMRLTDEWPVEVSRYKEYPEKMARACRDAMQSMRFCTQEPLPPRSFS